MKPYFLDLRISQLLIFFFSNSVIFAQNKRVRRLLPSLVPNAGSPLNVRFFLGTRGEKGRQNVFPETLISICL